MQRLLIKESYTVDYAGFWIRLTAFLIDILILAGLTYVVNGIWGVATGAGWMGTSSDQLAEEVTSASLTWMWQLLVVFFMQVGYFVCFWAWRGQTPGKMALRIKIVRFDGSKISWGTAVIRYLSYIISAVIIFIGFFWIAFDDRRQGIHDKIAETYVISAQK